MCIGSRRQVETVSRSLECSASVEGGLERFESGDLLRKEKTSVPFRDHDPSGGPDQSGDVCIVQHHFKIGRQSSLWGGGKDGKSPPLLFGPH